MAEPVPTTDTSPKPELNKLPPWAIVGIAVAGVGIAILYKKSKEKEESFFQPTAAAQNRPFEPGFGGSAGAGLGAGLASESLVPSKQELLPKPEPGPGVFPGGGPSTANPEPPPVLPSPTTVEKLSPELTPNQINAREKGFPVVLGNFAQPLSSPYPAAETVVEQFFPNTTQEHEEFVKEESHYLPPAPPNYPYVPTPAQYPGAFQTVAQAFPGGEPEHIRWVKEHSHYV